MATNSIKLLTGSSHPQLAKLVADRLGIELAKTMSLNYSNQETSVTVGESVRDEDGIASLPAVSLTIHILTSRSIHPPIHRPGRHQRWSHGTPHHDQRLQNCLRTTHHSRPAQFPLRTSRQERQIPRPHLRKVNSEHAANGGV